MSLSYCHPIDVSLAAAGEFEHIDDLGALVQAGRIAREITNQSGVILAKLQGEFGTNLNNYPFWQTAPIEHPTKTPNVSLIKATLADTIGMQQITIMFADNDKYSIWGNILGLIATNQSKAVNYNANGITILASDWSGTPTAGEVVFVCGYNVHPVIAAICAKLSSIELFYEVARRQSMEVELKNIVSARKHWFQMLQDIHDGAMELGGRIQVDVGQRLFLPEWKIDEIGLDSSLWRPVIDTSPYGSIAG